MRNKLIALAYSIENIEKAEEIEKKLNLASYNFNHIYGKKDANADSISQQLRSQDKPILLLISDNFLKSPQCMNEGLRLLQEKKDALLPVIIDGRSIGEKNGSTIPTRFERVSDIIQYINYWQDQYLDLRRQKRSLKDIDEDKFNQHLKVMRAISSEVGEFLRTLRTLPFLYLDAFEDDHFEAFFQFVEDPVAWDRYKAAAPKEIAETIGNSSPVFESSPIDLNGIPGIDLLDNTQEEEHVESEITNTLAEIEEEIKTQPEEPRLPQDEITPIEEEVEDAESLKAAEEAVLIDLKKRSQLLEIEDEEEDFEEEEEEEEEVELEYDLNGVLTSAHEMVQAGNASAALEFLQGEVEDNPTVAELRYHYAQILVRQKNDTIEAQRQMKAAVKLEPENEDALLLLADLYRLNSNPKAAANYYKQVLALNPLYPEINFKLGMLYIHNFEDKPKKAAKYFKNALLQDPDNIEANYQYAVLLNEALDKSEKAARYFKKVVSLDEQHLFAHYDLALFYLQQGEHEEARNAYLKAINVNPELETEENDLLFNPIHSNGVYEEEEDDDDLLDELDDFEEDEEEEDEMEEVEAELAEEENHSTEIEEEEENEPAEEPLVLNTALDAIPSPEEAEEDIGAALSEEEQTEDIPAEEEIEGTLPPKENTEEVTHEEVLPVAELELEAEEPVAATTRTKTVLINGAGSSLGKAIAVSFAKQGYNIALSDPAVDKLAVLKDHLEDIYGTEVKNIPFTPSNMDSFKNCIDQLQEDWKQIDILINDTNVQEVNSGKLVGNFDHWDRIIIPKLDDFIYFTKVIAKAMIAQKGGQIITLSGEGQQDVERFTQAMQSDLKPFNIRVSHITVAPSGAPNTDDLTELSPDDIADAVHFLADLPAHLTIPKLKLVEL